MNKKKPKTLPPGGTDYNYDWRKQRAVDDYRAMLKILRSIEKERERTGQEPYVEGMGIYTALCKLAEDAAVALYKADTVLLQVTGRRNSEWDPAEFITNSFGRPK